MTSPGERLSGSTRTSVPSCHFTACRAPSARIPSMAARAPRELRSSTWRYGGQRGNTHGSKLDHAAVDHQLGPHHERGFAGGKVEDGGGDLVRVAESLER